jgi:hypothetical protein
MGSGIADQSLVSVALVFDGPAGVRSRVGEDGKNCRRLARS